MLFAQIGLPARWLALMAAVLATLALPIPASAHPAPYSYLDVTLEDEAIELTLTAHASDIAMGLGLDDPAVLFDQAVLDARAAEIAALVVPHLYFAAQDGPPLTPRLVSLAPSARDEDALEVRLVIDTPPPPALTIRTRLFTADPLHHTFVNVHAGGQLRQQFLFNANSSEATYFAGTTAGALAVLRTFIPAGVHHVLIGPDHILFMVGLMLMGGSLRRLVLIVTAFTIGHSLTLALAALHLFAPPAWLIEPAIALSIVVVGVDNLLRGSGRDLRPLFALLFGLVHGFGFAFVLAEFGLPQNNLALALLGFNLGVELGQLAIVVPLALALAALRRRWPLVARRIGIGGSLAVIAAGAYWFVDRVRQMGSG